MQNNKQIATWLYVGVGMIMVQILLGGITRLTGSGLSITEWKPILGTLPPMSEAAWTKAFDGYKQIAQYKLLNADFTLSEFKGIYFWEWLHREWARLMFVVFVLPFVYFMYKKTISKDMSWQFCVILLAGALQGLVGWLMVSSGLNQTNVYVEHFHLAAHFISALVLLCTIYWYALYFSSVATSGDLVLPKKFTILLLSILAILVLQLSYGAFMAGLKAAPYAATWPKINNDWVPDTLYTQSYVSSPLNVHFIHRGLAYLLLILLYIWYAWSATISDSARFTAIKNWPFILVILQVFLGILTVLYSPFSAKNSFGKFEYCAQLHQLVAMFLLLAVVRNLFFIFTKKENTPL